MIPRLLDAGESALVVEFGTRIDDQIADRVLALDAALTAEAVPGVLELVPTYRSLMIHYDPLILPRASLEAAVNRALPASANLGQDRTLWQVPACYDPEFAIDLAHIAAATGLTADEVIAQHAGARYRLVMYGFAPGWAYLSGLPAALTLPRRESPRDRIPEGSLIVAGGQAIVAGPAMPSGWHLLGRTPERMFDPARDPPIPFRTGDMLEFRPVSRDAFDALQTRAAGGEILSRRQVRQ